MRRVVIVLVLALLCAGCDEQGAPAASAPAPAAASLSGDGTVRRGVGPECADTWSVETADGERLWPVNDPALQIEGLPVRFEAQRNEGAMSVCMAGTNVTFTSIERAGDAAGSSGVLENTAWRLQDLGGAGVIEGAQATLEFSEAGKAAGRGSCNRFFATVTVSRDSIRFGPVGATRMACEEPIASQEAKYLKALEGAETFVIEGDSLAIQSRDLPAPLLFTRTSP
jgi:heat shock protein HslJ